MAYIEIGLVSSLPVSIDDYTVGTSTPTDTFEFSILGNQSINLSLNEISANGDADLYLYEDINGNGMFDAMDEEFGLVASSLNSSNSDEAINVLASTGTYFAQVVRYYPDSLGDVVYDLDISATSADGIANLETSNVLPTEVQVGDIANDVTYLGSVGDSNTADVYAFSVGLFEGVNISLTGLTADADIRLISDVNGNEIIDLGEVIGSSVNGGSLSELITGVDTSGNYYLQVSQFSGSTNYTLTFDHYLTSFA